MVINIEDKINTEVLEKDDNGALELFCEYGGGNKKFHLYARNKEIGSLLYIGTLENTAKRIPNVYNRGKKAAEIILSENYDSLKGLENIEKYILIPFSWAEREEGYIPRKS